MTATVPPEAQSTAYRQPAEAVVAALGGDARRGLTTAEARVRLERDGRNELPSAPSVPAWRKLLGQFRDPLTFLLLAATAISFVAWLLERDAPIPYEAIVILAIVVLNGVLGFIQEYRAEQAVAALRAMAAPTARVLRDNQPVEVPTAEVVPGDILLIEEGDSLAADARLLEAIALRVAEAALTGESTPVTKDSAPIDQEVEIGDRANMVFSGTAVVSGRGRAVVTATGAATQIGMIAGTLERTEQEATPLQKELDRVGRLLGLIVIVIAVIISATILLVNQVRSFGDLVEVLLVGVSLAVAAVPEGLTAITTIVLSIGVQRMARRNVIVRRLSSVETLGSTTVICTDKTGTLTKNEMTVTTIVTAGGQVRLTGIGYDPTGAPQQDGRPVTDQALLDELRRTLGAATLANDARLVERDGTWTVQGDPTEGALIVAARKLGLSQESLEDQFERVGEIPFSSDRKMMSTAHTAADRDEMVVLSKGAPDVLLARCVEEWAGGAARALTPERRAAILATVEDLATEALRTLGVACRTLARDIVSDSNEEADRLEQELVWLGLVGMIDPPRPEATASVAEAHGAGIRVTMITGDHPVTAAAIAAEMGIVQAGEPAVTGSELQRMDDARLAQTVQEARVYARVAPEHKLRIVNALKRGGQIAAMTGDGVNDAPALRSADIGVAMGITGTDVAKGAADMVLTDDNFASIVAAVEEGRSIFADIQKALRYLLSSNMGEVLTMFLGVVLAGVIGLTPEAGAAVVAPLLATQILWINLLTDSGPALALGMDPEDPTLMRQPPRDPRSRVIGTSMWLEIAFVGMIMAAGTLLLMDWALPGGLLPGDRSVAEARTLAFTALVFFQLFNAFNARFGTRSAFTDPFSNPWLWLAVLASGLLQVAVIYVPFLQAAFNTVPLTPADWLICIGVGSAVLWIVELEKLVRRLLSRREGRREPA
jgi:Ca2+-transporting ATPase